MSNELTTQQYLGLDIVLDGDEPLLTQAQIASILGLEVNAVTKAISRALDTDEFDGESVSAKLSYTASDGKTYQVNHYTLDVLLWVGYRAHKSAKIIKFRKWVKSLAKADVLRVIMEQNTQLKLEVASLEATVQDEQKATRDAEYWNWRNGEQARFMLADLRHSEPIDNVED